MIKIPPPVIGLLCATGMWLLKQVLPVIQFSFSSQMAVALVLVVAGLLLDFSALWSFYKANTTINPLKPEKTRTIVSTGIYRYSRNPMYLGMLLILTGVAVYLGNITALLLLPLFVWLININQIKPEEQILEQQFGKSFTDYKNSVRRWV